MQYYTYKITFKDLPCYFYYGKHKDDGKPYFGSPKTWACFWTQFEPEIQVLQRYKTAREVNAAEKSTIRATWEDKYSLNENCGGDFSEEICRANGKASMAKMSRETRVANGKAIAETNLLPNCSANGKANAAANFTPEILSSNASKVNKQRWLCLVTGHVSSPGNLSRYQKARGIDTTLRIKISD